MIEDIGKGIKNVDNGILRMGSVITTPAITLLDINNVGSDEKTVKKKCIEIKKPDFLSMRACVIKSEGFIFVKNQLAIYENMTDLFRCKGDYFFLTLLQKGNANLEYSRTKASKTARWAIEQNQLYFTSDTDLQDTIHMKKGAKIQYVVLLLDKTFVRSLLEKNDDDLLNCPLYVHCMPDSPRINLSIPLDLNLYEAIRSLFELPCEEPIYLPFAKLKIVEILLLIKHNYYKGRSNPFIVQYDVELFNSIKLWVTRNYNQEFTLRSLSRNFGLNELMLKTGFKKLFGQTIRQFVIELRMNKAKSLIIQNEETVNEISFKVGYKSVSHFIQTFKKHYGITPSQHKTLPHCNPLPQPSCP